MEAGDQGGRSVRDGCATFRGEYPPRRSRRPARASAPIPLARRAARRWLELRGPARLPEGAGRVLADGLRLARPGGEAERLSPVHDRDRQADDPLPARPLPRTRRAAADYDPRLARLDRGVHEDHGPLTNPRAHGDDPADAFHVVAPSLPGFGFSVPVREPGWEMGRTTDAFAELMRRLGYDRYGAQGDDIGAGVTGRLAGIDPDHVVGYHVNSDQGSAAMVGEFLPMPEDLTEAEGARLEEIRQALSEQRGYFELQSTRPQTLAYSLADSPVGQLAWIVEKFKEWTNPAATLPDDGVDRDQLLTNVSIYWFTDTGGSSARFYYEGAHNRLDWLTPSAAPQGWAVFNTDLIMRRLMNPEGKIVHFSEFEEGGHFPAMEAPDLLVADVRRFFRRLR